MMVTEQQPTPEATNDEADQSGEPKSRAQEFAEALWALFDTEEEKQQFLERFDRYWPYHPDE